MSRHTGPDFTGLTARLPGKQQTPLSGTAETPSLPPDTKLPETAATAIGTAVITDREQEAGRSSAEAHRATTLRQQRQCWHRVYAEQVIFGFDCGSCDWIYLIFTRPHSNLAPCLVSAGRLDALLWRGCVVRKLGGGVCGGAFQNVLIFQIVDHSFNSQVVVLVILSQFYQETWWSQSSGSTTIWIRVTNLASSLPPSRYHMLMLAW